MYNFYKPKFSFLIEKASDFMKKVKMTVIYLIVFALVGSALAFKKFTPSSIFCQSGFFCQFSGFQTGVTSQGSTKFPCGAGAPIYLNTSTNCQSGGFIPDGTTDYYRNIVQ